MRVSKYSIYYLKINWPCVEANLLFFKSTSLFFHLVDLNTLNVKLDLLTSTKTVCHFNEASNLVIIIHT